MEKDKLIMDLKNYLEGFIKQYKNQPSLHLLDISKHLGIIREYDKEMKKLKKGGVKKKVKVSKSFKKRDN